MGVLVCKADTQIDRLATSGVGPVASPSGDFGLWSFGLSRIPDEILSLIGGLGSGVGGVGIAPPSRATTGGSVESGEELGP